MRNHITKGIILVVMMSVFITASFAEDSGDEAQQYANILLGNFRSGGVCDIFSSQIRRTAHSGAPVNVRIMIIDKYLEAADKQSCVRY